MNAGIYIHIPFCHVACHYCNFHFSTNLSQTNELVNALVKEITIRKQSFESFLITSIYFGGGTPSILSPEQIKKIIDACIQNFTINSSFEFTIEANPEDINHTTLEAWDKIGINRISLGIQSLNNNNLKFLNRNHTKEASIQALDCITNGPIKNYSVDIIYGIHNHTLNDFKIELKELLSYNPTHISAYNLTIEPKTTFGNWLNKNKIEAVDESASAEQFEYLIQHLPELGYEQYEISNFCKPGFESKHNSSYWHNQAYLGIGPGAHSFVPHVRSANISNNALYIKHIDQYPNEISQSETLSIIDQYNEYLLTRLRTKWGISLSEINGLTEFQIKTIEKHLHEFIDQDYLYLNNSSFLLTSKGKLFADEITLKLML